MTEPLTVEQVNRLAAGERWEDVIGEPQHTACRIDNMSDDEIAELSYKAHEKAGISCGKVCMTFRATYGTKDPTSVFHGRNNEGRTTSTDFDARATVLRINIHEPPDNGG